VTATLILFNDFEATGIDTDKDVILEGYFDLRLVDPEKGVVGKQLLTQHVYIDSVYDRSTMHPIAEKMHVDNGLWDDLEKNEASKMTVAAFDSIFTPFIAAAKEEFNGAPIHLGGMGVANYDKRLIERDMPQLNSLLHYRCEDISVIHMHAKLSGWKPAPKDEKYFGNIAHRAKEDVEQSIGQFLYFSNQFRRLMMFDNKISAAGI
jgi:oligoribonuclease (3'-5' exoribonuclease)